MIRIAIRRILLWMIIIILFLLSFAISILTQYKFRPAIVTLLALPLMIFYKPRVDEVFISYIALFFIVIISGIFNRSSIINIFLFLRVLIFSYLTYYLVHTCFYSKITINILKFCIIVGVIQLPVIILQRISYNTLPHYIRGEANIIDFASGTFNYKTDYAMSFFLIWMLVFLLFEGKRNYFIKYKTILAIWYSLTIILSNSQIMKIPLLLVWIFYIITAKNHRKYINLTAFLLFSAVFIIIADKMLIITEDITTFIVRITNATIDIQSYLQGNYNRFGGILYLLGPGFTLLGDGPSSYYNPITRTLIRGNTGHFFLFFSEVGFLGWLASIIIFLAIIFRTRNGTIIFSLSRLLMFISIFILSFTANVMNDSAVFLTYCLAAFAHRIPCENRTQK